MYRIVTIILLIAATCVGQIPDPNDPNNRGTNSTPVEIILNPRPVKHGIIYDETLDSIYWHNLDHTLFDVQHRQSLTEGSWISIAPAEVKEYRHDNPSGFYRVIPDPASAVFPIWNSGSSGMDWYAVTDCPWLELVCDLGINIPVEFGEDHLKVRVYDTHPSTHEVGVITVMGGDSGSGVYTHTQQVTVVINDPYSQMPPHVPEPPPEVVGTCLTCTGLGLTEHDPSLTRRDMPDYQPRWDPPYVFSGPMTNENGDVYHQIIGGVEDEGYASALIGHGWQWTEI
jgi:hypothetical protein